MPQPPPYIYCDIHTCVRRFLSLWLILVINEIYSVNRVNFVSLYIHIRANLRWYNNLQQQHCDSLSRRIHMWNDIVRCCGGVNCNLATEFRCALAREKKRKFHSKLSHCTEEKKRKRRKRDAKCAWLSAHWFYNFLSSARYINHFD